MIEEIVGVAGISVGIYAGINFISIPTMMEYTKVRGTTDRAVRRFQELKEKGVVGRIGHAFSYVGMRRYLSKRPS